MHVAGFGFEDAGTFGAFEELLLGFAYSFDEYSQPSGGYTFLVAMETCVAVVFDYSVPAFHFASALPFVSLWAFA